MEAREELIKSAIRELLRISKKYQRIEKMPILVSEGVEITTQEAHTIQAVGEQENISVTGVALHFGVTKSAASQVVARLAKKGFLLKGQALDNNKELQLTLTELGWRAFHAHEQFHGEDLTYLIERLSVFPLQQIAVLSVMLETISSVMGARLDME